MESKTMQIEETCGCKDIDMPGKNYGTNLVLFLRDWQNVY